MPQTSKFDEKLWEARYFVERMRALVGNPDTRPLTANLRACMGAARSVVLYAEEDAFELANGRRANHPRELANDAAVGRMRGLHKAAPVLRFVQGLRNGDVHVKPSGVPTKVEHRLRVVAHHGSESSAPVIFSVYTYHLVEWPNGPDVFTLCDQYIAEVEKFLDQAFVAGLIKR